MIKLGTKDKSAPTILFTCFTTGNSVMKLKTGLIIAITINPTTKTIKNIKDSISLSA